MTLTPKAALDQGFRTLPVTQTFFSDRLTPIDIAEKLGEELVFLLESRETSHTWSRHSFIGLNPFAKIEKKNDRFTYEETTGVTLQAETLKTLLQKVQTYLRPAALPKELAFVGGAVGAVAYDAVSDFDRVPPHALDDLKAPPYHFVYCETVIAFDHYEQTMTFVSFARKEEGEEESVVLKKVENLTCKQTELANLLFHSTGTFEPARATTLESVALFDQAKSTMSKEAYVEAVETIKEYIRAGDIFQAVLSNRYELPLKVTPWQLYRSLRIMNPSPYLFYIKIGEEFELVGSSPERLVNIDNQEVEIHPIAGTRKRGQTLEEDEVLMEDLLADEKERAEHMMLVDLARNDVGRVATYGSVKVPVLMEATPFAQVIHLVSIVKGTLDPKAEPIDALVSAFPAGTLSGAPKIRAMEIISELEPVSRGFYGGAVGYIGFDGNMDTCITIRTFVCHKGKAYVQAGAGIVADSIPENEWEETRNKARALFQALNLAEQLFSPKEVGEHV